MTIGMMFFVGDPTTTGVPANMSRWVASDNAYPPTDASASITLNSDGTISATGIFIARGSPNWYNPTSVGIGSSYWVRATRTGGAWSVDPDVGSMGTWESLAGGYTWSSVASGAAVSQSTEMRLDFSTDSGGSSIVASIPLWYIIVDVSDVS